jgi:hypothetical protein
MTKFKLPNVGETNNTAMDLALNQIKEIITELQTPENLEKIRSGEVGSIARKIELPIGHIPYYTRQIAIQQANLVPDFYVINSIFNREPFLSDENTIVNKTAYLIRYMFSVDDFNGFPLSLISDPNDSDSAGFRMTNVLLAKDRGHFMTILYDLVHCNTPFEKSFWLKVKKRLMSQTSKGKSTPTVLKNFQEVILESIVSNSTNETLTLSEIVPAEYFNKIYTSHETVTIRLETIYTHKSEISGINDEENNWRPHNYGLTGLTAGFISEKYYDFNLSKVEKYASSCDALMGKSNFLSSRSTANFSGFETEPIFIILANGGKTILDNYLYKSLAGSDKDSRGDDYSQSIIHKLTTKDAKDVITKIKGISNLKHKDTKNCLWLTFNDIVSTSETEWEKYWKKKGKNKSSGHFAKLRSGSMDTALFYYFTADYLVSELGHRSGVTTPSIALKEFIEWWGDDIKMNQNKFWNCVENVSVSWSGRYEVMKDYILQYVKYKKVSEGNQQSVSALKKSKLQELRTVYSDNGWPHSGQMWDRNSNGWILVDYDLTDGRGFNLCHYVPNVMGGRYTVENTDMGTENDNKFVVKDTEIPTNYFGTDGDFYKSFKSQVVQPEIDSEDIQSYVNTLNFAKAYNQIYKKRKELNESISNT